MRVLPVCLLLIFGCHLAIAQAPGNGPAPFGVHYYLYISKGRSLRNEKAYRASGQAYDSAFQSAGWRGRSGDLYDAACSWALAGAVDEAYNDLYRAVRGGRYGSPDKAANDSDLVALKTDKRWPDILEHMKANKMANDRQFDLPLQDTLNRIYTLDQSGRLAIDSIEKRYGSNSRQMDSLYDAMSRQDSADQHRIVEILARRPWPSPDEVGERASMAVFLVIQHGDSLMRATYLPMMREAVKVGAARPEDLALVEDRLLTEQGKPQIYGSQVRVDSTGKAKFFPIADEAHVDERRASVGLEPLESYARYFGIDYHPPVVQPVKRP